MGRSWSPPQHAWPACCVLPPTPAGTATSPSVARVWQGAAAGCSHNSLGVCQQSPAWVPAPFRHDQHQRDRAASHHQQHQQQHMPPTRHPLAAAPVPSSLLMIPSVREPPPAPGAALAALSSSNSNSSNSNSSNTNSSPVSSSPASSSQPSSSRVSSSPVSNSGGGTHAPNPQQQQPSSQEQQQQQQPRSLQHILHNAGVRALGGGLPGAAAMVVQVLSLMWLRTTVNYQYRYGTSTSVALRTLYREGGIARFYRGVGPALLQGPLCRFGDTAANAGMLALLSEFEATRGLPFALQTAAASAAAGCWRMLLLPLDATKTMMQVEGKGGLRHLWVKVATGGPGVLYHGAAAALAASFVGHFPWFTTYNTLNELLPVPDTLHGKLLRSAGIGFCAGVASDAISNSVRVVKTSRQTARRSTSYRDIIKSIVAQDGVSGLFTRGLKTRIAANGLQNMCFTVLWSLGQDKLRGSSFMARLQPSGSGSGSNGAGGSSGG